MSDALEALKAELERFGEANDDSTEERPRRMLNITRETGEFLAVLVRVTAARRVLVVDNALSHVEQMAPFVALIKSDPLFATSLVSVDNGEFSRGTPLREPADPGGRAASWELGRKRYRWMVSFRTTGSPRGSCANDTARVVYSAVHGRGIDEWRLTGEILGNTVSQPNY